MALSRYYRVRKRYLLRGWEKLPFAIVDSQKGVVTFVPKAYMAALARCDGRWDFDSPLVSDEERMAAAVLLEKGIIEKCEPLIRPDFMEIVAALSNADIVIRQLYTNGLLLTHGIDQNRHWHFGALVCARIPAHAG